jgi:hypothetical protein
MVYPMLGGRFDGSHVVSTWMHDVIYHAHLFEHRMDAEHALLEALRVEGAGWWKREAMYRSLAALGWKAWNAKTDEEIDGAMKHIQSWKAEGFDYGKLEVGGYVGRMPRGIDGVDEIAFPSFAQACSA